MCCSRFKRHVRKAFRRIKKHTKDYFKHGGLIGLAKKTVMNGIGEIGKMFQPDMSGVEEAQKEQNRLAQEQLKMQQQAEETARQNALQQSRRVKKGFKRRGLLKSLSKLSEEDDQTLG
jgi:hypothetical protein